MTAFLQRDVFRAMGTTCSIAVAIEHETAALASVASLAARREVAACERALSRFDTGSDLSRVNRESGSWVSVDERLVEALGTACRLRASTRGKFDPTILPALVAAGYDRSFERLTNRPAAQLDGWRPGARIDVDAGSGLARVERGAMIDLGGLGKGFAAARALDALRGEWPAVTGALVDLGGDIAIWGVPPGGGFWLVDVEDPRSPGHTVGTLRLAGGGVATSGCETRRFGPDRRLHHLIDPSTGMPSLAGPYAITVVAPSASEAEAYSTALAVCDPDEAHDLLDSRPDLAALLVPRSGAPISIGPLPLIDRRPVVRFVITDDQGKRFACR